MNVREAILKRKSIRVYQEQDVPQEDLLQILDAGRLAPSGKNSQNWHFLVVRSPEVKKQIAQAIIDKTEEVASLMDQKDPEKGNRFRSFTKAYTLNHLAAPVWILVYAKSYTTSGYEELRFAGYPKEVLDQLLQRSPSMQNIGAAMENMTLQAVELGYGSCWMTGQNYAADEIEQVISRGTVFQKKEGSFLACMLVLGVPQGEAKSPAKKPLSEICTFL
jgi:nitroreductase